MSDDEKKKRKRKPARFVITKQKGRPGEGTLFWDDEVIPDECKPPDSTAACMDIIKGCEWHGKFRIIQIKKTIEVKVEQKPTTTITDIE